MTNFTIIYTDPCRLDRLRAAFAMNIHLLGPLYTAQLVDAVQCGYIQHRSTRVNFTFALHALHTLAGLDGLSAIAIVKEAWNEGSLRGRANATHDAPQPIATITHPSTNTTQ